MLNCGDSQSRAVTKIFLNRGILFEIFLDGEVVQGTQLTDSMGAFFSIECGVMNATFPPELLLIRIPPPGELGDFFLQSHSSE